MGKGQNTSSAVMAQRLEPRGALDDFPTPPWATRALCEYLFGDDPEDLPSLFMSAREPCANRGYMSAVLEEYFDTVDSADVHDYGVGYPVRDYLAGQDPAPVSWTITNPPFTLAEQFVFRALRTSTEGVAVLVRSVWLEGGERWRSLFSRIPPQEIRQFSERVPMHKGKVPAKGSTATAYAWVIWDAVAALGPRAAAQVPEFGWFPPGTRKRLERPGDYDKRGADAV